MNRRAILTIVLLALLLACPLGPPTGSTDGAAAPAMYTTLTHFKDNSTKLQKNFYSNGTNSSSAIVVPAAALMKIATVQIQGMVLETEAVFSDDTSADFQAGGLDNISIGNGSLLLRPILVQTAYGAGSAPLGITTGDVNYDGHKDIVVANSGNGTVGVFLQDWTVPKMGAQQAYLAGQSPEAVVVGDFNSDGLQDVAAACSVSGTLEVLHQKRDGTLSASVSYVSGNGTHALATGDLNRDGRKDIVTVNSVDSTISLFIQNMSGALYRFDDFDTGTNPTSVASGDIDLDGQDEVVVTCMDSSTIMVFEPNSTSGLKQTATYDAGSGPVGVAIGDVNRDGRNDVAVAEWTGAAVGILNQTQAGLLAQCAEHPAAGAATAVAIGDLDFDGRADIAVATSGGNISVFWQRADRTLSEHDDYRAGAALASVAIADMNSDGKNDLAVANSGDGTVGVLPLRPFPAGTLNQMAPYNVGSTPIGLASGDLNSDGLDDILVGNAASANVGVLLQGQNGALNAQVPYSIGWPLGVAACDLNLDGRDDIVIADQTPSDPNNIKISYQTPSGDFSQGPVKYHVFIPYGLVYIVACGDLNSDGWPDMAVSSVVNSNTPPYTEPNNVTVLIQNASSGQFDLQYNIYCPAPRGVAIGDVNSDGRNDLCVAATTTNELWVFIQDSNRTLSVTPARYSTDTSPHGIRIGDLNADGRNDVVTADWTAINVDVFVQNAAGTLNPKTGYPISNSPTDMAVDVEIGDFDSDGLNDLAVSHYTGSAMVSILNQTRQGTFSAFVGYNSGQAPANLAKGDFNGDGSSDLSVANRNSNTVGIFAQQLTPAMNGTFTSRIRQMPYEVFEATAFWNYSTTGANQTPAIWLSNDRGATWTKAVAGQPVTFPAAGESLAYRIRLASQALNRTPTFENITVRYRMRSYPQNPSLDIGMTGTPIWNWTGPFGLSGRPVLIEFTARVNVTLQTAVPDGDGNILLPFLVRSRSLGTLVISNLSVQYDLAPTVPLLMAPADNEYIVTAEPSFRLKAWDNDTAQLIFKIQLSQDNFSTIRSYNPLNSPGGWDKQFYTSGEAATFQLPQADRLNNDGTYQWRAYVWDGTLWSAPSNISTFRLDTKPPTVKVNTLPTYTNRTDFTVSWTGSDPEPGSGLAPDATYDVQFKDSVGSPWTDWLVGTNATSADFSAVQGKTCYFQARARDRAGNEGHFIMGTGDTRTKVDTTPPAGVVEDDGLTTGDNTRLHAKFSFVDDDSGIARFQYWIGTRTGEAGDDILGPTMTENKDVTVVGLFLNNGTKYFFNVRVQNGAGIWSQPMPSDGITVKLKMPQASIVYPNGAQKSTEIPLRLAGTDPNGIDIADGDLEYKVANVQNKTQSGYSDWKEMGDTDWGDAKPGSEPLVFTGELGKAYKFRYRVRDAAQTYSDYSEPANVTRINRPPVPQILVPVNGTVGVVMEFWANGSYDPDGDRLDYTWDFGDGWMDYGRTVTHRFSAAKKYTILLYADDSLDNSSIQMEITVRPARSSGSSDMLSVPIAITAVAVMAGVAYALVAAGRRKRTAAPGRAPSDAAPHIVPGSDRPAPPLPPPKPSEVEAQIAAAKEAIAELEQLGVETSRATKMLGLASSFLADDNLLMASQYSKKAVKLARDQKQRLESEVDEETARRFVTDTQRMLETDDTAGLNVKEAKKLFGLSISFLAEGNYVTGMQYSKKVRRILEELRERLDAMPATREAVEVGLESLQASIAELKRAGNDTGGAEGLLDMARMFFQEEDYQPAREQLLRARALVLALKEKDRPFTAPQWKDVLTRLKEKTDRLRGDGLRIEEPMKMLRLSESFALQGNLEVASQYIRKAEKLLSDIEDRARARSQKKETVDTGPPRCPRCGEESEADWVVCAYCNTRLKAEPPAAPDGSMPPPDVGEIRIARPVEENEQRSTGAPVREVKKAVKVIRPGNR